MPARPPSARPIRSFRPLLLAPLLGLSACATTAPETRVTRFHLDQPIAPASFAIEPRDPAFAGLEFDTYAAAVSAEMGRLGFTPGARAQSELVAVVDVVRTFSPGPIKPPPFSIGIGGASFGRNVGVGGGVNIPIGKARATEYVQTGLSVQIKRRSDNTVIWEGRAQTDGRTDRPGSSPAETAPRLAAAMFGGFPGESQRTIRVK